MTLEDLYYFYKEVERIINSDVSWKAKYDLIFSDNISQKLHFEWTDPDSSYQDDVLAFKQGFDEYMNRESK